MELQNTIDRLIAGFNAHTDACMFACRALVAAISALVTHELVNGGPDGVQELHTPLMALTGRLLGA